MQQKQTNKKSNYMLQEYVEMSYRENELLLRVRGHPLSNILLKNEFSVFFNKQSLKSRFTSEKQKLE